MDTGEGVTGVQVGLSRQAVNCLVNQGWREEFVGSHCLIMQGNFVILSFLGWQFLADHGQ